MTKPKAAAKKAPSLTQRVKALEEKVAEHRKDFVEQRRSLDQQIQLSVLDRGSIEGTQRAARTGIQIAKEENRRLLLALAVVAAIAVAGLVLGVAR